MSQPIDDVTNDGVLQQIAQITGDVTPEQVASVLVAWNNIHEGDPVGMVRRDPETGAIAMRADDNGVHVWRVNMPNGEQYNDMQPTLPWPVLYSLPEEEIS